jgi:hypothetical protein
MMSNFTGDISTAATLQDFIAALRKADTEYDPAQVTNPECATMKIQYESIRDDRKEIADHLERLLEHFCVAVEGEGHGRLIPRVGFLELLRAAQPSAPKFADRSTKQRMVMAEFGN